MSARIHHISILNRYVKPTFEFYHNILGLKLLMKTINQDDHSMYHLFFSDNQQRIGTEITFFEMQEGEEQGFGTNTLERTILKVPTLESLHFWEKYLEEQGVCQYGIEEFAGQPILRFDAPDNTQMALVPLKEFENRQDYFPYEAPQIPLEHAILGISAIQMRVQYAEASARELLPLGWQKKTTTTFFTSPNDVLVLENLDNDFYQEVHIIQDLKNPPAQQGVGGIHHVAFGVENLADLEKVDAAINERNFKNSGIKDREFFKSLYYREPNQLLIEIATKEGSLDPEAYSNQSDTFEDIPLYLPQYLSDIREETEQILAKQQHE
ncbi:VOC family protein [Enterococcus sp. HY326]|uniref:VOC family protein n=1 Tax=Enterococcus sp. HY326 TaxID=2971265 RepID=UPI0022406014|nr:VOC family protein [Enterococcus sp. HY326]